MKLITQLVDAKEIYSYLNALENIERWGNEKDSLSKNFLSCKNTFYCIIKVSVKIY